MASVKHSSSHLVPAIVYGTADGHIHELALQASWRERDLTAAAGGAPAIHYDSRPMAFRRSDGVSMVVYQGEDDHIHALYLEVRPLRLGWVEIWRWADLSLITGSPPAASGPHGYVRSDGISAVVYVGADQHVHELRFEDRWIWADLMAMAGSPLASSVPTVVQVFPCVRGDGGNAVLYVDQNRHITELRLRDGWRWTDLTAQSGAPQTTIEFSAYVRSDGISAVVFNDGFGATGKDVHELWLSGGWHWANLTSMTGVTDRPFQPFGYARSDGINCVVYYDNKTNHIMELRLDNGWKHYDLSSAAGGWLGHWQAGYVRMTA